MLILTSTDTMLQAVTTGAGGAVEDGFGAVVVGGGGTGGAGALELIATVVGVLLHVGGVVTVAASPSPLHG